MCHSRQLLKEMVNGSDGNIFAIREMYTLEGAMTFGECEDALVRKVDDSDQPDATKLAQRRNFNNRKVGQVHARRDVNVS